MVFAKERKIGDLADGENHRVALDLLLAPFGELGGEAALLIEDSSDILRLERAYAAVADEREETW